MARLSQAFEEKLVNPRDLAVFKAQSINDLGSGSDDLGQATVSASADTMTTTYRVDYSDYGNYVFFNSALDYFNISGEKIINEYPRRGSYTDVLNFMSGCDGYQKWLFEHSWPATLGDNEGTPGLVLDPEKKFVPGSSSFSVEMHMNPWAIDAGATTLIEKSGTWSAYLSGSGDSSTSSSINFKVFGTSGSASASYMMNPIHNVINANRYLSFICDRDAQKIMIVHGPDNDSIRQYEHTTGFMDTYPRDVVVLATASIAGIGDISGTTNAMTVGSGTYLGAFNCTAVSYWSKARTVDEIRNSYAGNIFAQDNLVALYRYDESITSGSYWIIENCAGEGLTLLSIAAPNIQVHSGTLGSFSSSLNLHLTMSRMPIPMTKFNQTDYAGDVLEPYISNAQLSATMYDKNNTNIITRMIPEVYLELEQEVGTEVLQNFLYIIARQFDEIKVAIDQFVYWNKSNYTGYNDTPDALLKDAANFYGWDFIGNFLNHDAIKYFFGKGVVQGTDLEVKLYQVKNEFWRRTLNELSHIYKTKGTRESVEALIRVYGMDQKLVKLKEYGVKPNAQITTTRINSHRSLPAYTIRDGVAESISSLYMTGANGFTLSMHACFPHASSSITGTIATVGATELKYFVSSGSSMGTIQLKSGSEIFASGSASFVDGQWWNIFITAPPSATGGWNSAIRLQKLDEDTVVSASAFTGSSRSGLYGTSFNVDIGHVSSSGGKFYVNEVKLYADYNLSQTEMDAQTLDFQSYGVLDIDDLTGSLRMHWRLDDDFVITSGVNPSNYKVFDFSGYGVSGTTNSSFIPMTNSSSYAPFKRFLYDYNFIAPVEYGWNEDKIRVYPSSSIPPGDHFNEANALALEFNLVDALNEDISKMLATMDNWNNVLGVPANKYRDSYPDLNKFRNYYFKKLEGRINFRKFADILEFFDRSFVKMIQRLLPARAIFYGEEFVVESHMLERPKVQWAYRRYNPELVPEGIILMTDNQWTAASGSYQYPTGSIVYG